MFNIFRKKRIKKKSLLIFYIDVGNLESTDIEEYIKKFSNNMNSFKQYTDLEMLFVPNRKEGTRVELMKFK